MNSHTILTTLVYKNEAKLTLLAVLPPNGTSGKELELGGEDITAPANNSTKDLQHQCFNAHDSYHSRPIISTLGRRNHNVCVINSSKSSMLDPLHNDNELNLVGVGYD